MRSSRFLLLTLAAAAGCTTNEARRADTTSPAAATLAGSPANDVAAVSKAIAAADSQQTVAFLKGDTAAVVAYYADDAILLVPNDKIAKGRAEVTKAVADFLSVGKFITFKPHREDLIVTGDYAIETATMEMTIQPKTGKPIQDKGKFVTVFKKQPDGSYKAIRDIFNSDLPAK